MHVNKIIACNLIVHKSSKKFSDETFLSLIFLIYKKSANSAYLIRLLVELNDLICNACSKVSGI